MTKKCYSNINIIVLLSIPWDIDRFSYHMLILKEPIL